MLTSSERLVLLNVRFILWFQKLNSYLCFFFNYLQSFEALRSVPTFKGLFPLYISHADPTLPCTAYVYKDLFLIMDQRDVVCVWGVGCVYVHSMSMCMCVCVYACVCVCMYLCVSVCVWICACMHSYVCVHVSACIRVYCMCLCVYVCIFAGVCIVCVCMCVCVNVAVWMCGCVWMYVNVCVCMCVHVCACVWISCHIISYHIISYHIISYHTIGFVTIVVDTQNADLVLVRWEIVSMNISSRFGSSPGKLTKSNELCLSLQ